MIKNIKLTKVENEILSFIVSNAKEYKEVLVAQVSNCDVTREVDPYYNLTFFKYESSVKKFPFESDKDVVFELLVYFESKTLPMDVLLYSENSVISELEFYNGDLTKLSDNGNIDRIIIKINKL